MLKKSLGRMSFKAALFLVPLALCLQAADEKSGGQWVSLFNNKDLSGWTKVNDGTFIATNGMIHLEGGKGWLRTERQFTNFIFEVEWRGLETNFNSGVFLRAPLDGNPWPENVWQANFKQSAVGELLSGSNKVLTVRTPPPPVGAWVKFRVEARGRTLTLSINDVRAWEFKELEPACGFIGLQAEGKAFDIRNLRILELPGEIR